MPLSKLFLVGALALGLSACAVDAAARAPSPTDPSNPEAAESPPYRLATVAGLGTPSTSAPPPAAPAQGGAHAGHEAPPTPSAVPDTNPSAATVYTCPMHPEVVSKEPGRCPECGMNLVPQKPPASGAKAPTTVYTCPMHPEVTAKEPGRCPECGMNLVPQKPPAAGAKAP